MSQTHAIVDLLAFLEAVGQKDTEACFTLTRHDRQWHLIVSLNVGGHPWSSSEAVSHTLELCVNQTTSEANQWLVNQSLS